MTSSSNLAQTLGEAPGASIPQLANLFFTAAKKQPTAVACRYYEPASKQWLALTWDDYEQRVRRLAGWLLRQGIGRGDRVALISRNRPEWIICDLAILACGAVSVPLYPSATPKDIQFILEQSGAKMLFYDQPERREGVKVACPAVGFDDDVLARVWTDPSLAIAEPVAVAEDDLATIVYTSGTTGVPKGVIHTHGTLMAATLPAAEILNEGRAGADRFISFLPLSHVAERLLVEIGSILVAGEVVFARSPDTLVDDMRLFPPTILLCVPRLWERLHESIAHGLVTASRGKTLIFNWAVKAGACRIEEQRILRANDRLWGARIADALVGRKLRRKLGMHQVRTFFTGSAPTSPEILRFFASLGIFIREVYGLTENLCLGVYTPAGEIVVGTCGKTFAGNELRLAPDGEILMRAPYIFKGYYRNAEATAAVLGDDGWFATGDYGDLDEGGRLRILGRKKELLKTSTGHYVAPVPIENALKREPMITDAMVVGDSRKYCVALVTIDARLAAGASVEDLLKQRLTMLNQDLTRHEQVLRLGIMKEGFSIANGLLTPTLKLRRSVAAERHAAFIERLYRATDLIVYE